MNPLRSALAAIFLGATCALAQPAPVHGAGRVPADEPPPAPRTRYELPGRGALEQAGLIPAGYAYTFEGVQEGNAVRYTQLVFTAPGDEDLRAVKLEYVDEVKATSIPGAEPRFGGIFGAPAPLARSIVGGLVLEHAKHQRKSMVYTLRGWKVTRTTRAGDEVSFLVLASHAKAGLGARTYWVDDVTESGWGGHWSLTRVDDPTKGIGVAHQLCSIRAQAAPQTSAGAGLAGALPGS